MTYELDVFFMLLQVGGNDRKNFVSVKMTWDYITGSKVNFKKNEPSGYSLLWEWSWEGLQNNLPHCIRGSCIPKGRLMAGLA